MTLSFEEWLKLGVKNGYCSPSYCQNHDLFSPEDEEKFSELYDEHEGNKDFCWPVVRIGITDPAS
tara:strand:+ start:204 stop:398 length:195 start_codon:yes stop_codon:yes gene_type:complete